MNLNNNNKIASYSTYIIGWIFLLALTSVTIILSGMDLGKYSLFITLTLAIIQCVIIINTFMKVKFSELIFKVFILISCISLIVILFTSF